MYRPKNRSNTCEGRTSRHGGGGRVGFPGESRNPKPKPDWGFSSKRKNVPAGEAEGFVSIGAYGVQAFSKQFGYRTGRPIQKLLRWLAWPRFKLAYELCVKIQLIVKSCCSGWPMGIESAHLPLKLSHYIVSIINLLG